MTEVNCPFKCIMFTIYLNYLVFLLKMTLLKRHTLPPMVKMRAEMEFVCKRSMKSLHLCLARSRCLTSSPPWFWSCVVIRSRREEGLRGRGWGRAGGGGGQEEWGVVLLLSGRRAQCNSVVSCRKTPRNHYLLCWLRSTDEGGKAS